MSDYGQAYHDGYIEGEARRKAEIEALGAENKRLRGVLSQLASIYRETPVGVIAERALMTDEQRQAFDSVRGVPPSSAADPEKP